MEAPVSLFVNQIPYICTQTQLEKHFGGRVNLLVNADGSSRGICFVEFDSQVEAKRVQAALDKSTLAGRTINVSLALSREESKARTKARRSEIGPRVDKLELNVVESLIQGCIRRSKGTLKREDFDDRVVEFMRTFDVETLRLITKEFTKIKATTTRSLQQYMMGVMRRHQAENPEGGSSGGAAGAPGPSRNSDVPKKDGKKRSAAEAASEGQGHRGLSDVEISTLISVAVAESDGRLEASDFDARHRIFLREFPPEVAEQAVLEFATYTHLHTLRAKGSYLMGILKRHKSGESAPPQKKKAKTGRATVGRQEEDDDDGSDGDDEEEGGGNDGSEAVDGSIRGTALRGRGGMRGDKGGRGRGSLGGKGRGKGGGGKGKGDFSAGGKGTGGRGGRGTRGSPTRGRGRGRGRA